MQALFVDSGKLTLRRDVPIPEPAPGETLIRISLCGICSTDLEIVRGYAGFSGILGHEFVGVVERTGSTEDENWVGRRVVGTINIGCGECNECLANGPEHCPNRTVLGIINKDGIFADYAVLPVSNLLPVPQSIPDELAVFTEPLAAALRIREQIPVRPTARIAVVGPGRLGLLVAQVLALSGSKVIVFGRRAESLSLPANLGLATDLIENAADNSFDLVVEATGNDAGFSHALRIVRPQGTLVLKSTFAGNANLNLTKLVVGEVTVVGSRCGPFAPALRLLEQAALAGDKATSVVRIRPLINAEYPLNEALAAFEYAAQPGIRKVLVRPN
ncbi:MAG: alcohol dehydrogenase catalytic domain-containing protein [Chloroflexota bacterium]